MYGGRVAPCFAHGHAGIKPVTFPVLVVVSLTGTLSPTSLISSLQKCLKRIREYFIYIFMQRADLWLERLYMWWIVEGFVRIRHFSGTHFHLRSRLFGRREDGFIFKFNVWLYGCNTYLHYLPFALYDEGKLFSKNTIPTASQKLPDSRGDVFKRVVLSGPAVWTLQICNLISYKKRKREKSCKSSRCKQRMFSILVWQIGPFNGRCFDVSQQEKYSDE